MPLLVICTIAVLVSLEKPDARWRSDSMQLQLDRITLRHHPGIKHRVLNQTTTEFFNWSGYGVVSAKGAVTDVKGSWVVPSVECSTAPDGYASFWTGIDGWDSNTVEQTGTDSDCVNLAGTQNGTPTYYAWFEFYPHAAFLIGDYTNGVCNSDCVFVGDVMSAEVKAGGGGAKGQHGGQQFTATITDVTQNWTFTTSSAVNGAKQSSAEWIAETPFGCKTPGGLCDLADFGVAEYGNHYTNVPNTEYATVGGQTGALGSFGNNVQEAIMVNYPSGTTTMAQPSSPPAYKGTSFTVTWENPGP
jgi:hypothetical protein